MIFMTQAKIPALLELGLSHEAYIEMAKNTKRMNQLRPETRREIIERAKRVLDSQICCSINKLVNFIFSDSEFFKYTPEQYTYSTGAPEDIITSSVADYLLRNCEH